MILQYIPYHISATSEVGTLKGTGGHKLLPLKQVIPVIFIYMQVKDLQADIYDFLSY